MLMLWGRSKHSRVLFLFQSIIGSAAFLLVRLLGGSVCSGFFMFLAGMFVWMVISSSLFLFGIVAPAWCSVAPLLAVVWAWGLVHSCIPNGS